MEARATAATAAPTTTRMTKRAWRRRAAPSWLGGAEERGGGVFATCGSRPSRALCDASRRFGTQGGSSLLSCPLRWRWLGARFPSRSILSTRTTTGMGTLDYREAVVPVAIRPGGTRPPATARPRLRSTFGSLSLCTTAFTISQHSCGLPRCSTSTR